MAHLQDPQGAAFAVSSQEQRSRYKDPQLGDFSWHELLTSNWQTAFDFYSKLFGWEKMQSMDMGPQGMYQIFGTGGHQLGGMFNPGGLPRRAALDSVRHGRRRATHGRIGEGERRHGRAWAIGSAWRRLGLHRHRPARRDVRCALEETCGGAGDHQEGSGEEGNHEDERHEDERREAGSEEGRWREEETRT